MNRFELTEQHVALIRRMNVSWWDAETGAPAIDPKRPYGNGDVAMDIIEILDLKSDIGCHNADGPDNCPDHASIFEGLRETVLALHRETGIALQVVLAAGSFEPGVYECHQYRYDWRRV